MTVGDRVPTLGDLCDLQLVTSSNDPFAIVRLLQRYLDPEPSIEEMRKMTIFEIQQHFDEIAALVRDKAMILMVDSGKQKH